MAVLAASNAAFPDAAMVREQESKQPALNATLVQSASDLHSPFWSITEVSLLRAASTWPAQVSLLALGAGCEPDAHAAATTARSDQAAMRATGEGVIIRDMVEETAAYGEAYRPRLGRGWTAEAPPRATT